MKFLGSCLQNYVRPTVPLSGIEHLMESHATPLLVLPQSKLVENTAKFLQNKIDVEKCGKDWICSQNLVSCLTQTKFYRSQNQCFLTDNIPPLEADASLLDLSPANEDVPFLSEALKHGKRELANLLQLIRMQTYFRLLHTYVCSSSQCLYQLSLDYLKQ